MALAFSSARVWETFFALAGSCWVALSAVSAPWGHPGRAVPGVVFFAAVATFLLFPAVPGKVSMRLAAEASLPLHAVVLYTSSELLSKRKAVVDGVLSCLFRAKPDSEGGVPSEGSVFLLHPGNILDLVAELREVVLLADLLDTAVFRINLNFFGWCEMNDDSITWAGNLGVVS